MLFGYKCDKCEEYIERDFRVGKAQKKVKCPKCGAMAGRSYDSFSFILKGGGWPGKGMSMDQEMTKRNEAAGHRMRKHKPPVRTVAHDYGNGDVREVKGG